MGYDPKSPEAGRPAASQATAAYAHTVTIQQSLTFPGKDLGIYERRLVRVRDLR